MYAIIEAGGKQYKVEEGKTVKMDKLSQKIGDTVEFKSIIISDKGKKISTVPAKVTGRIKGCTKDKKIIVFKKRPKKGYKKTIGHRQNYTEVEIVKIG
ncbi:MAG: 50S ribosomal protein L21 [Elusimicrobia bacterium]|nr:50S ribosomal protein L21 [Elusimicrobiota bacterium]